MVLVDGGDQVDRLRFGEDALEGGAAVQVDAHLQSLIPVEQLEAGGTGRQRRRRHHPAVAGTRRKERAGPQEGIAASGIAASGIAAGEVEVTIDGVAQDLLLGSSGPFGFGAQRCLGIRPETEIRRHRTMVLPVVPRAVQKPQRSGE